MNPFVRSNRHRLAAFAVAAMALATPALAGLNPYITSQTSLSTYEDVIDLEHRYLYTNVSHQDFGTGVLQYHYSSTPQANPFNNAAYVDPATGKMRVFAYSDASVLGTVGVEPPFNVAPSGNRSGAGATVEYTKQLEITAGSTGLAAGAPVKLTLTFHLDGRLAIGGVTHDPAPVYSAAHMISRFTIEDQAVLTDDDSIYQLVNFSAHAERTKTVYGPGDTAYPDGAQISTKTYQWQLTSNDPNEPAHDYYDHDYREDGYNFGTDSSGTTIPVPFANDFDTGTLIVTFDTYVGAVLDISALLDVDTTSNALSESPYASANFMNTFALEFTPAEGFEGLTLLSNAVTPEPASLSLLALALPLVARRRSR